MDLFISLLILQQPISARPLWKLLKLSFKIERPLWSCIPAAMTSLFDSLFNIYIYIYIYIGWGCCGCIRQNVLSDLECKLRWQLFKIYFYYEKEKCILFDFIFSSLFKDNIVQAVALSSYTHLNPHPGRPMIASGIFAMQWQLKPFRWPYVCDVRLKDWNFTYSQ